MTEIRTAILSDYTSVAQLHADNWRKTYRGILSDYYLDNEVEADRLETWRTRFGNPQSNQRIIVADDNGVLVGFSCILIDDDVVFGSLIDNLHVAVQSHKTGLGKRLITESASLIVDTASSHKMYLWVYEQNTNARIFYDRMQGVHFETVIKENESGTRVPVCRYVWEDAGKISV